MRMDIRPSFVNTIFRALQSRKGCERQTDVRSCASELLVIKMTRRFRTLRIFRCSVPNEMLSLVLRFLVWVLLSWVVRTRNLVVLVSRAFRSRSGVRFLGPSPNKTKIMPDINKMQNGLLNDCSNDYSKGLLVGFAKAMLDDKR